MRRLGRDEWAKLVAEYESSGLSQKEFVAKHELSLHTLRFHLYKLRKETAATRSCDSRAAFLPLEVVASPAVPRAGGEGIELRLRTGSTLLIPVGTDVRYLAELLSALG